MPEALTAANCRVYVAVIIGRFASTRGCISHYQKYNYTISHLIHVHSGVATQGSTLTYDIDDRQGGPNRRRIEWRIKYVLQILKRVTAPLGTLLIDQHASQIGQIFTHVNIMQRS